MGPVLYQKILKHGSTFLTEPKFWGFCMAKTPKIAKFLKKGPIFPVAYLGGCIACACTPGGHKGAPKSDQKGRQKEEEEKKRKERKGEKEEKGRGKGKEKEKRKEKETKKRKGYIKWKERERKIKKGDKWKEI